MKPPSDREPLVVTDTGPLIALARSNDLGLLEKLFGGIIVPESVCRELCLGQPLPGNASLNAAFSKTDSGFRVEAAPKIGPLLAEVLDPGEAEAIALAASQHRLLLIDERKGL